MYIILTMLSIIWIICFDFVISDDYYQKTLAQTWKENKCVAIIAVFIVALIAPWAAWVIHQQR
jgi:hypothetical protein